MADEADLRRFLEGPYARILRSVALVCDSHAAAQDVVHEAIAQAWERRQGIEHLDRWVLTVALNLARSRWRKVRRELPPDREPVVRSEPGRVWSRESDGAVTIADEMVHTIVVPIDRASDCPSLPSFAGAPLTFITPG